MHKWERPANSCGPFTFFGSPSWARTSDLRINSPSLYQLSYQGTAEKRILTSFSFIRQHLRCNFLLAVLRNFWFRPDVPRQGRIIEGLSDFCHKKSPRRAIFFSMHFAGHARLSRTPANRRRGSCAASARWSCTACGFSSRGRYRARRRRRPARLHGSPRGSASSCRGRC